MPLQSLALEHGCIFFFWFAVLCLKLGSISALRLTGWTSCRTHTDVGHHRAIFQRPDGLRPPHLHQGEIKRCWLKLKQMGSIPLRDRRHMKEEKQLTGDGWGGGLTILCADCKTARPWGHGGGGMRGGRPIKATRCHSSRGQTSKLRPSRPPAFKIKCLGFFFFFLLMWPPQWLHEAISVGPQGQLDVSRAVKYYRAGPRPGEAAFTFNSFQYCDFGHIVSGFFCIFF